MSKSKRIEAPIELVHGTFKPGDPAIAVTVRTGRVHVARVTYLGYIEASEYSYRERKYVTVQRAQVRRPTKIAEWYNKVTGEKLSGWRSGSDVGVRYVDGYVVSTLQYNRLVPATATVDELMEHI